jgi:hypothetical protein
MSDVMREVTGAERIAFLCHQANRTLAEIAEATRDLPTGTGAILSRTKQAGDALAAILRECDRIEAYVPPELDKCPGCGQERPKERPPGPPPLPGQYYCVNHRHLKRRSDFPG